MNTLTNLLAETNTSTPWQVTISKRKGSSSCPIHVQSFWLFVLGSRKILSQEWDSYRLQIFGRENGPTSVFRGRIRCKPGLFVPGRSHSAFGGGVFRWTRLVPHHKKVRGSPRYPIHRRTSQFGSWSHELLGRANFFGNKTCSASMVKILRV